MAVTTNTVTGDNNQIGFERRVRYVWPIIITQEDVDLGVRELQLVYGILSKDYWRMNSAYGKMGLIINEQESIDMETRNLEFLRCSGKCSLTETYRPGRLAELVDTMDKSIDFKTWE